MEKRMKRKDRGRGGRNRGREAAVAPQRASRRCKGLLEIDQRRGARKGGKKREGGIREEGNEETDDSLTRFVRHTPRQLLFIYTVVRGLLSIMQPCNQSVCVCVCVTVWDLLYSRVIEIFHRKRVTEEGASGENEDVWSLFKNLQRNSTCVIFRIKAFQKSEQSLSPKF